MYSKACFRTVDANSRNGYGLAKDKTGQLSGAI